jgi:uncharacterized damage-inducible protein DinB
VSKSSTFARFVRVDAYALDTQAHEDRSWHPLVDLGKESGDRSLRPRETTINIDRMEMRYGTPVAGTEKEVLTGFLDHYRKTLLEICGGLSEEELRRPMVPSGTSLLGIVKHLAYVERGWFQENVANEPIDYPFDFDADPDADFRIEDGETSQQIFDLYRASCERSRQALEDADLDDPILNPDRSRDYNVRWVVVHMIEETARHAGHADIIREQLDGRTGAGYTSSS